MYVQHLYHGSMGNTVPYLAFGGVHRLGEVLFSGMKRAGVAFGAGFAPGVLCIWLLGWSGVAIDTHLISRLLDRAFLKIQHLTFSISTRVCV